MACLLAARMSGDGPGAAGTGGFNGLGGRRYLRVPLAGSTTVAAGVDEQEELPSQPGDQCAERHHQGYDCPSENERVRTLERTLR